jgi:hypothetical protein
MHVAWHPREGPPCAPPLCSLCTVLAAYVPLARASLRSWLLDPLARAAAAGPASCGTQEAWGQSGAVLRQWTAQSARHCRVRSTDSCRVRSADSLSAVLSHCPVRRRTASESRRRTRSGPRGLEPAIRPRTGAMTFLGAHRAPARRATALRTTKAASRLRAFGTSASRMQESAVQGPVHL